MRLGAAIALAFFLAVGVAVAADPSGLAERVTAAARTILGRNPTPDELPQFQAFPPSQVKTVAAIEQLYLSSLAEDQQEQVQTIARAYRAVLKRDPSSAEVNQWMQRTRNGPIPFAAIAKTIQAQPQAARTPEPTVNRPAAAGPATQSGIPPAWEQAIAQGSQFAQGRPPSQSEAGYLAREMAQSGRGQAEDVVEFIRQVYARNAKAREGMVARAFATAMGRQPESRDMREWDQRAASNSLVFQELVEDMHAAQRAQNTATRLPNPGRTPLSSAEPPARVDQGSTQLSNPGRTPLSGVEPTARVDQGVPQLSIPSRTPLPAVEPVTRVDQGVTRLPNPGRTPLSGAEPTARVDRNVSQPTVPGRPPSTPGGQAPADVFTPSEASPGSTVTLSGQGRPGTFMSTYFRGKDHVGTAQVDAKGNYALTFQIPPNAPPGDAFVQTGCDNCGNDWRTVGGLRVVSVGAPPAPPPITPPNAGPPSRPVTPPVNIPGTGRPNNPNEPPTGDLWRRPVTPPLEGPGKPIGPPPVPPVAPPQQYPAPVMDGTTFGFYPASVPPGEMGRVAGKGLPNAEVEFFFMGKKRLGKSLADKAGKFDFAFQVPLDAPVGLAYLTCSNCAASTVTLPGLQILQPNGPVLPKPVTGAFSVSEVKPGQGVQLSGKANPGTTMAIRFMGNKEVGHVFVNERGEYSGGFNVSADAPAGEAFVTVGCDDCTNGWNTIKGLTVVPDFAARLSHSLAAPGTEVTVSGTAKPGAVVSIGIVRLPQPRPLPMAEARADGGGNFSQAFVVPDVRPGKMPVVFGCDNCGKAKGLELLVPARLSKYEGMPGENVTLEGVAKPNTKVSASMRGNDGRFWSIGNGQADANGNYSLSLTLPDASKAQVGKTSIGVECDKCAPDERFGVNFTMAALPEVPREEVQKQEAPPANTLEANQELAMGRSLKSPNGAFVAVFQSDGNFVLYDEPRGHEAYWSSRTHNQGANRLIMQGDGNLVVYKGNKALWASNTERNPGAKLVLQSDGNLVIYGKDGRALWDSKTIRSAPTAQGRPIILEPTKGCLDVPNSNFKAGQALQVYECNTTAAQQFTWEKTGEIKIGGLCVDAFGGHRREGDVVGLWTCHGGANQRWKRRGGHILSRDEEDGVDGKELDLAMAHVPPQSFGAASRVELKRKINEWEQMWRYDGPVERVNKPKLYVVDGTDAHADARNVIWQFYQRFDGAKEYWEGPNLVGSNTEVIFRDVLTLVCQEQSPKVYLAGFSRGAIIALTVANEARKQCGINVAFVGLIDPVNTSNWGGFSESLDPGVPVAVSIEKPVQWDYVLTTKRVGNVTLETAPIHEVIKRTCLARDPISKGMKKVPCDVTMPGHMEMACPAQDPYPGAGNLQKLIDYAKRAGLSFNSNSWKSVCDYPGQPLRGEAP